MCSEVSKCLLASLEESLLCTDWCVLDLYNQAKSWDLLVFLCLFQTVWLGVRSLAIWASLILGWTLNVLTSAACDVHSKPRKTHLAQEDKIRQALIIGNWTNFEKAFQSMLETWGQHSTMIQALIWSQVVGLCFREAREPNIGWAFGKWASTKFNDGKQTTVIFIWKNVAATLDEGQVALWKQQS